MGRVIRKKTKAEIEPIKATSIGLVVPDDKIAMKLSTEDTSWFLIYKDEVSAVFLAMDGTYETISIPVTQFNREKYTFEADDGKSYTAKISMYKQA